MTKTPPQIVALLILVILIPPGCTNQTYHVVPPNLTELDYRVSLPLVRAAQGSNFYLEGTILGMRDVKTTINADCSSQGQTVTNPYQFLLTEDDLIDVTLESTDGILPGPNNGKSFILNQIGSNSQSWSLLMIQGANPIKDYLYSDTWRFLTNAHEIGPGNEVGDGGEVMPPFGTPPWQRLYRAGPIGGTYRLTSLYNLVTTVAGTITFTLHRTLPAFCSAGNSY